MNQQPHYYDPNIYLNAPGYTLEDLEESGFETRAAAPGVMAELGMAIPRGLEGTVQGLYGFADFATGDALLPDYDRDDRIFGNSSTWYGHLTEGLITFGVPAGFVAKGMGAYALGMGRMGRFGRFTAAGAVTDFVVGDPFGGRMADMLTHFGVDNGFIDWLSTDPEDSEIEARLKNVVEGGIIGSAFDGLFGIVGGARNYFRARAAGKSLRQAEVIARESAATEVSRAHAKMFREAMGYDHDEAMVLGRMAEMMGIDMDRVSFGEDAARAAGFGEGVDEAIDKGVRGATFFADDGRAIIVAFRGADVTTGIHEMSHVVRRQFFNPDAAANNTIGVTPRMLDDAAEFAGAKKLEDGRYEWTSEAEEKFATALEKYLLEGKAPTPELKPFFDRVAEFFRRVYDAARGYGLDIEISPEMRKVFDDLFTANFDPNARVRFGDTDLPVVKGGIPEGPTFPDTYRLRPFARTLGRPLRTTEGLELSPDSGLLPRERTMAGRLADMEDGAEVEVFAYGNSDSLSVVRPALTGGQVDGLGEGIVLRDVEFWNPNTGKPVGAVDEVPSFVRGQLAKEYDRPSMLDGVYAEFDPETRTWVSEAGYAIYGAEEATVVGGRAFLRGNIRYWDGVATKLPEGARAWDGATSTNALYQSAKARLGSLDDSLQVPAAGVKAHKNPPTKRGISVNGVLNKQTKSRIEWAQAILRRATKRTGGRLKASHFRQYLRNLFGDDKNIPLPMRNAFDKDGYFKSGAEEVEGLSERQLRSGVHGLKSTLRQRAALLADDEARNDPRVTAYLMFWALQSRKASPATQEAAFVDVLYFAGDEFDAMLDQAIRGEWDDAASARWYATFGKPDTDEGKSAMRGVLPEGSPSRGVTMNVNAFGPGKGRRADGTFGGMLPTLSKRIDDGAGNQVSLLEALHRRLWDPAYDKMSRADQILSDRALRRWFMENAQSVGIDTKAFSFLMLVSGRHHVMVVDRIQARRLWQDGTIGWVNLNAGKKVWNAEKGKEVAAPPIIKPVSSKKQLREFQKENQYVKLISDLYEGPSNTPAFSQLMGGASGLALYEAIEDAVLASVDQTFKNIDPGLLPKEMHTAGAWHWLTWIAEGRAEVEHGSLDAVARRFLNGGTSPREAVVNLGVPDFRYGERIYGWEYAIVDDLPRFSFETPLGREFTYDLLSRRDYLETVSRRSLRGILDDERFKGWASPTHPDKEAFKYALGETDKAPWTSHDFISERSVDLIAEAFSRESGQAVGTRLADRVGEDGVAVLAGESARLSARRLAGWRSAGSRVERDGSWRAAREATRAEPVRGVGGLRGQAVVEVNLAGGIGLGGGKQTWLRLDSTDPKARDFAGLQDGDILLAPTKSGRGGGFVVQSDGTIRIVHHGKPPSHQVALREVVSGFAAARELGGVRVLADGNASQRSFIANLARVSELEAVNPRGRALDPDGSPSVLHQGPRKKAPRDPRFDGSRRPGTAHLRTKPRFNYDRLSDNEDLNILTAQVERSADAAATRSGALDRNPQTLEMVYAEGQSAMVEMFAAFGERPSFDALKNMVTASAETVRREAGRLTAFRAMLAEAQEWTYGHIGRLLKKPAGEITDAELAEALRRREIFSELGYRVRSVQREASRLLGGQRVRVNPRDFPGKGVVIEPVEKLDPASIADIIKKHGGRKKIIRALVRSEAQARLNPHQPGVVAKARGVFGLITEWYINSILSGTVTFSTNFLGGVFLNIVEPLERALGSLLTWQPRAVKGEVAELMNMVAHSFDNVRIAAMAGWRDGEQIAKGVGHLDEQAGKVVRSWSAAGQGWREDSVAGQTINWLGKAVNIPGRLMMTADQFNKATAFRAHMTRRLWEIAIDKYPRDKRAAAEFVDRHLQRVMADGHAVTHEAVKNRAWAEADARGLAPETPEREEFVAQFLTDNWDGEVFEAAQTAFQKATQRTFTNELGDARGRHGMTKLVTGSNPITDGFSFRESFSQLSARLADMANHIPWLKLVVPFVRTPANIFLWAYDRSFGALSDSTAYLLSRETRAAVGREGQAELMGRVATGISFITAASVLASEADESGIPRLTGAGPLNDSQRKVWEATGWKPYSLRVGDKWVQYKRLDPAASILGLIADMVAEPQVAALAGREQEMAKAIFVSMVTGLRDKTYLAGLANLINVIQQPERDAQYYWNSYIGGFMPGSSFVQQTWVPSFEQDQVLRETRTAIDAMRSRYILSDRTKLPPRRNVLGEEMHRDEGLFGPRDSLSPIRMTGVKNDAIALELVKTGTGISPPQSVREGVDWLEYQNGDGVTAYDRFMELTASNKLGGRSLRQSLQSLVTSNHYQRLAVNGVDGLDSPRARLLKRTLFRYRDAAARQVRREFPELEQAIRARRFQESALRAGR